MKKGHVHLRCWLLLSFIFAFSSAPRLLGASPKDLRLGIAGHAFDHLGAYSEQADTAVASGANILYCTGLGGFGYLGLPAQDKLLEARRDSETYIKKAKAQGVRLAIGYICATSIVKLETFDKDWTPEFRAQFRTAPKEWLQLGKNGKPLPSWYGGDYQPACMNNPDWRTYEKQMVRFQLEAGHDGIFFDNPTVHPQGCYCRFCMEKFAEFMKSEPGNGVLHGGITTEELRRLALDHPKEFMLFRCTTARDFLAEMRTYARTIKRDALVTCNNSLNSPDVFYAQCRSHAYNIYEMSKAEDFVVVEDMSTQPRKLASGSLVEYGPTYRQLHAISHGKPVVAVTVADGDYCTPPNLVRLAMAEAAANGASYLLWPTWPENQRQRMSAAIRPEADLLRRNEKLLNDTQPRCDVMLFLPFRRWVETSSCVVSKVAAQLQRANVQFGIFCEDDFKEIVKSSVLGRKSPVVVIEAASVLSGSERALLDNFIKAGGKVVFADKNNWWNELQVQLTKPSVILIGPASVRVVVQDQSKRSIVHVYNLNVEKVSSLEDKVYPVTDVKLAVRVPFKRISSVHALTADSDVVSGKIPFTQRRDDGTTVVEVAIPKLKIGTILCIEK
jgi:hypothetical protein